MLIYMYFSDVIVEYAHATLLVRKAFGEDCVSVMISVVVLQVNKYLVVFDSLIKYGFNYYIVN